MAADIYLKGCTAQFGAVNLMIAMQVEGLDSPQATRDPIETTHCGSTDAGRTYIPPLFVGPATITLTGRMDPTQAYTFNRFIAVATTKLPITGNLTISFNQAGALYRSFFFADSFLTSFTIEGEFDNLVRGSMTVQLPGDPATIV